MPGIPSPRIISAILAVACLGTVPRTVLADTTAGLKLAQRYCAECHMVIPNSARGWTDAPAFEAIANRQTSNAASLGSFIQQPHMHMLNTQRQPVEADEIAAYIMSLRVSATPAPVKPKQ